MLYVLRLAISGKHFGSLKHASESCTLPAESSTEYSRNSSSSVYHR